MLVSATNSLNHEDNVVLAVQSLTTSKKELLLNLNFLEVFCNFDLYHSSEKT